MHLLTSYVPPTFLKPCIVISTLFIDHCKETAVAFVNSLNSNHAIEILYQEGDYAKKNRSEFIPIKKHRTLDSAVNFHIKLAKQLRNGCGQEIWERGWKPYLQLYDKFCPPNLKQVKMWKKR